MRTFRYVYASGPSQFVDEAYGIIQNLDFLFFFLLGGENVRDLCISVHVKGPQVIKISRTLYYSMSHNHIVVMAHETPGNIVAVHVKSLYHFVWPILNLLRRPLLPCVLR